MSRLARALAGLLLWAACAALAGDQGAAAATPEREALLRGFVDGQHGFLPFTTERAVPFLIRAALDRKLEQAGQAAGLDEGFGREAPEWQAADGRAEAVSHELESAFDMRVTAEEARALLADVSDADIETLIAFQRSPVALRLVRATDLSLSALLVSTVASQPLPPVLAAARSALETELADRKADARITTEDQAALLRMLDKPVYVRVEQAARRRLQTRLQADNPMKRLDALLDREAQAAVEAYRRRTGR